MFLRLRTLLPSLVLLSLIPRESAAVDYTLPLTGKFFYAQIMENEEAGMYIPVMIGDKENQTIYQNWHISSNEHMLGVYDDTCMLSGMGCVNTMDPTSMTGLVNDNITDGHREAMGLANE